MTSYVAAIDQGTTSTRCMIFSHAGEVVSVDQKEHEQIFPQAGWVEHDPEEVWRNTREVAHGALAKADLSASDIVAVGITNQRETAVVWDKNTGKPVYNAIVWQDTRTDKICAELEALGGGQDRYKAKTGLPLATYFSGPKNRRILDNCDGARQRAEAGDLLFGNMDTCLLWNMTGGPDGGVHVTDPTNASRTLLMDLRTLRWDDELLDATRIPRALRPEIRSSSEVYGKAVGDLAGVPVAGILGDQPASLFGHTCFDHGDTKNTYGTGAFLLFTLGSEPVISEHGLITTVAWQLGAAEPVYALEGSVAMAGALVQWLRDNLGIIHDAPEIEQLARSVPDSGGVVFVPAFSGLFAPYWRLDARGVIVGLTRFANKGHIARAALEAAAYQTNDLVTAMLADTGLAKLDQLRVDGGMTKNDLLMQFQANLLDAPVVAPAVAEI